MLRVAGLNIVNEHGDVVVLRGAGIGGHMNMENFITGFPGHEHEHREAMLRVLGPEKYSWFLERFYENFFTDADAEFFASLGLNCLRIPFNYRHFEDDMNPGVFKPEGFALLDRIIATCSRHKLFVILDLHAVPGGQNQDWHCDSGINRALFWEFKDFQDRMLRLWGHIAARYAGNSTVAGYNPLNEPADPKHSRLIDFYCQVEKKIRAVDPDHILFLDGNTYAMDFSYFPSEVLPNTVYSCHDYSTMGFPAGQAYVGSEEQNLKLRHSFMRKTEFMRDHHVPIWNGEFGPVYADGKEDNASEINRQRFNLLEEQLKIYREANISWSIWLYKDIGYQGMVYLDPESPYMKLIQPFLERKRELALDYWGCDDSQVRDIYEPFLSAVKKMVPVRYQDRRYPKVWSFEQQFLRVVRNCLLSEYLADEMAELFSGKTHEELDALAGSFAFARCLKRSQLNEILRKDSLQC